MNISEFVTGVLTDIEKGMANARNTTGKGYIVVDSDNLSGVHFDIAVTTTTTDNTTTEGKANAGYIQVLGAGIGVKNQTGKENNEVSRIQFSIHVPKMTDRDYDASANTLNQN